MKITIKIEENANISLVSREIPGNTLSDALCVLEDALKGLGYVFKGRLTIESNGE